MSDCDSPTSPSTPTSPRPSSDQVDASGHATCHTCGTPAILLLCEGKGKDIHNYHKWYLKCNLCDVVLHMFDRRGNPTPLEHIPEDIQVEHAIRRSRQDGPPPTQASSARAAPGPRGTPCVRGEHCRSKKSGNKHCVRLAYMCASCCIHEGGCRVSAHNAASSKSTPSGNVPRPRDLASFGARAAVPCPTFAPVAVPSIAPLPATDGMALDSHGVGEPSDSRTAPTEYKRAIDSSYGNHWLAAQQKYKQRSAAQTNARNALETLKNSVHIVLWYRADDSTTQLLRMHVNTALPGAFVPSDYPFVPIKVGKGADPDMPPTIEIWWPHPRKWVLQGMDVAFAFDTTDNIPILMRSPGLKDGDCMDLDDERDVTGEGIKRPRSHEPSGVQVNKIPRLRSPSPSPARSQSSKPRRPRLRIRPCGLKVFPHMAIEDLIPGMDRLRHVGDGLPAVFAACYPDAKFVSGSFYRYRTSYELAIQYDIVETSIKGGLTFVAMCSKANKLFEARRPFRRELPPPPSGTISTRRDTAKKITKSTAVVDDSSDMDDDTHESSSTSPAPAVCQPDPATGIASFTAPIFPGLDGAWLPPPPGDDLVPAVPLALDAADQQLLDDLMTMPSLPLADPGELVHLQFNDFSFPVISDAIPPRLPDDIDPSYWG